MQLAKPLKILYKHNPSLFLFLIALGTVCFSLFGYYLKGRTFLLLFVVLIGVILISATLLRWPFVGLLIMLIATPAEELVVLPGGRTAIFAIGVIVMFFWLIHILRKRGNIQIVKQPTLLITLLLCWGLMSFFWAVDKSATLVRVISFTNLLLFYILFQDLVKNNKQLKIVLFTCFISGIIYSLITIGIELQTHAYRASLVKIQNPNHLARSLIIGLLVTPYIFINLKSRFLKIITILGAFIFVIAIIMTGGRGAWLGLVMAFILTSLITKNKIVRLKNLIIIGVIVVIFVLTLYQINFISQYTMKRITTLTDIQATRGASGRIGIWYTGLQMVKDNPIIGVGLNNFPKKFEDYIEISKNWSSFDFYGYGVRPGRGPHSTFLSIQGELGIIGLVLFLLFFWTIFKSLLYYKKDLRAIIGILLLSFIFFTGISGTIQWTKTFWTALSMATLIPIIIRNEKRYEKN